jgi:hypothetical protein
MALEDLTGQKFGRWKVLCLSHRKDKRVYWLCECSCEAHTQRPVWASDLRRAGTHRRGSSSCGCLMRELASIRSTKHGMSHHPGYRSWIYARSRCNNPEDDGYPLYGGRGIKFSELWEDFSVFWQEMGPTWYDGASIERINTDGNYEPGNGAWATPKEQANNRRDNHIIETPQGDMNVTQAAEMSGLSRDTIYSRIRYGWPDKDLLAPVCPHHKKLVKVETEPDESGGS